MRVAIANFGPHTEASEDFGALWDRERPIPRRRSRIRLFEQPADWGFHLQALGVHLLDRGLADEVEFWNYAPTRTRRYRENGILEVEFCNEDDAMAYIERTAPIDLFVNHGVRGGPLLQRLAERTFRVHVPTLRSAGDPVAPAECYLFDAEDQLDERSMVYVPVVNTARITPGSHDRRFDFIYLASVYEGKRHDLLLDAVRGSELTGHLHPVTPDQVDVRGCQVTTSALDERSVVELLQSARIAVYPGAHTSNPAAMWECVAADLPIVVNREIRGGKHLVVPGVTGELSDPDQLLRTMRYVLEHRDRYRPREYLLDTWDTVAITEGYLEFFARMGWNPQSGTVSRSTTGHS